ncbi:MAG: hypothetical protein GWP14_03735 [Actinobacteria bacterium]|nr:hypothetical protein [Actinomycetota bacterium]
MKHEHLAGYEVLVCVTGGIAAYKAAGLVSALIQRKAATTVAMTANATRLIGPATFGALTGQPVYTDMWKQEFSADIGHISLSDRADLVVVAPATANILAKMAAGIADDLISTTLLSVAGPVLLAPAMNERMWSNPATQQNVSTLKARGHIFVGPESGWQACGKTGLGRMSEPQTILQAIEEALQHKKPKSVS